MSSAPRVLRCYAEDGGDGWEAFCLDLDIAVQGRSFEEVYRSLNEAIHLYVESASELPEKDRRQLLERPAPLSLRLKFLLLALRDAVHAGRSTRERHQFTMPLAA